MPPEGYKPFYAGAYGGDFDQKDAGQGSRVYLPVLIDDALVFFGDPHAAISDGIEVAPISYIEPVSDTELATFQKDDIS